MGTGHISSHGARTGQYLFSRMRDQSIFIISARGWSIFCVRGNKWIFNYCFMWDWSYIIPWHIGLVNIHFPGWGTGHYLYFMPGSGQYFVTGVMYMTLFNILSRDWSYIIPWSMDWSIFIFQDEGPVNIYNFRQRVVNILCHGTGQLLIFLNVDWSVFIIWAMQWPVFCVRGDVEAFS